MLMLTRRGAPQSNIGIRRSQHFKLHSSASFSHHLVVGDLSASWSSLLCIGSSVELRSTRPPSLICYRTISHPSQACVRPTTTSNSTTASRWLVFIRHRRPLIAALEHGIQFSIHDPQFQGAWVHPSVIVGRSIVGDSLKLLRTAPALRVEDCLHDEHDHMRWELIAGNSSTAH